MSGLLRRIKRSRPADAGEPLPQDRAAAPEGAATPAEAPPAGAEVPAPGAGADAPHEGPAARPPVLHADPATPAGIDPAEAPMRPPAGRRGRLRRRLRYLRRARELMLRDLGGLLYEIHRTGGGNLEPHANVVGAKVQRIAGLDAEAHALEAALGSPRAETVVFQPGVGGTCATCGELYGSAAAFCSNCGAPVDGAPAPVPAAATEAAAPAASPTTASDRGAGEQPTQVLPAEPATEPLAAPGEAPETEPHDAGPDEPRHGAHPPAAGGAPAATPDDDPPAAAEQPPAPSPGAGDQEPRRPFSARGNGRAEDGTPPDVSSGDPLVTRESRS